VGELSAEDGELSRQDVVTAAARGPLRRIVAVHPNSELYGSDRMFVVGAAALARDNEVSVVLPQPGPLLPFLQEQGLSVEVMRFPILRKVEMRGLRALIFVASLLVALPRLVARLRRADVEVLYVSTVICPIWLLAGRLAGCRVVCHVHENEPDMAIGKRKVLLAPLHLCSRIIANSESTRDWVSSASGRLTSRTEVVYNGVEAQTSQSVVSLGKGSAGIHLVVVGRISERKGQDVAIEALHQLRERGYDVDLTMVGDVFKGYEQFQDQLAGRIGALGLGGYVSMPGFTDNPSAFFAAADIVLVPSRVEPFGNVAVEAQLAGKPVVASSVQGLPEIVIDGDTGLLVPPGNPSRLADAVAQLLDDPEMAATLALRGAARAHTRFAVRTYAQALVFAVVPSR
jgi:glycosyltransferase involved in cell wall biosynthesis